MAIFDVHGPRAYSLPNFPIVCAVVALCVTIRNWFLVRLMRILPQTTVTCRFYSVSGVIGVLIAHGLETWFSASPATG